MSQRNPSVRRGIVAVAAAGLGAGALPMVLAAAPPASPPGAASALPADVDGLLAAIASARTLEEAIAARARLIDVAGGDDRAPTWMVEQAAALLDRIAADGADGAVLFGIPTPQQRRLAEEGAAEALALVARADDAATRVVSRVQRGLIDGGGDAQAVRDRAAAAERTLARLVDLEQGVRIPFFRGRAAVLLAALERERSAREDFARVTLESLGKLRLGTVAAEASRRVALAGVLLLVADGAPGPRKQAGELLAWVVEQPSRGAVGDTPDPVTRAQAWMGMLRAAPTAEELRGVRESLALASITEPFVAGGRADPLLALLTAEGTARAMLAMAPADGADRAAALDAALAPLAALLRRDDLAEHRAALRPIVFAKLASAAADRATPLDRLDPLVAFAKAVTLAQRASAGEDRAGGASEPARLLESVVARPDADAALRAEALWELAVIRWEGPRREDAVDAVAALCRLAVEFPESPRAVEAAQKAVELARYTLGQFAQTPPEDPSELKRLESLYAAALEAAVKLAPMDPGSAQQRLERARIVLDAAAAGQEAAMTPEELDSALTALEGIPESDPRRAEADQNAVAAIDRALEAARESARRAAAADRAAGGEPVLAPAAHQRVAAIARRAVQWAQQRRPSEADRFRMALAGALLDSGDGRAEAIYQDILDRAPKASDLAQRARLGLGRSQRAAGRGEEAFATLRTLVDEIERAAAQRRPATAERPAAYWPAWAEMLEILSADNRDGRRTDTIRLQLNRLTLVDPAFGGGDAARRIEAVRASVGSQ